MNVVRLYVQMDTLEVLDLGLDAAEDFLVDGQCTNCWKCTNGGILLL